ncbi:YfbM family protein [Treponema pedis]|uniref:YfbM family protein n=1 Tax=Treponema pedis TaxID=409322 RepID=A0A7S7AVT3_9SPIR|nr:YfbM family protein [Treponema pedis]QOW60172.1 YfbM family protein [Treponema pedis]
MGMIANYQLISDEQLKSLKNFNAEDDEVFEAVEDWNEEAEILCDLDKMWDVLHFVLTGHASDDSIKGNPLSEAVVGVSSLDDVEEFIAYTEKSKIADIVSALDDFDIEKTMENFSMKECKKAKLYPDIWDYEEETDDIKDDLMNCFQNMKAFYKEVLEANGNVMVTIY